MKGGHLTSECKDCAPCGMVGAADGPTGRSRGRGDKATKEEDVGKGVSKMSKGGAVVEGEAKGEVKVLCLRATDIVNASGGFGKQ